MLGPLFISFLAPPVLHFALFFYKWGCKTISCSKHLNYQASARGKATWEIEHWLPIATLDSMTMLRSLLASLFMLKINVQYKDKVFLHPAYATGMPIRWQATEGAHLQMGANYTIFSSLLLSLSCLCQRAAWSSSLGLFWQPKFLQNKSITICRS